MPRMVWVQICLAAIAFGITAWIFFGERPQAVKNQQLHQQLSQAQQENQQLTAEVKLTKDDVKQSRAYLRDGRALFHQQKYDQALELYDKALQSFPDDPYGWSLKGYALFRAGRIPESIEANRRAVELDPGDPLNYIDLAKSYCAAKQYQDAKAVLRDARSDTVSDIGRYLQSDGEIRRVCKPVLTSLLAATATSEVGNKDH